MLLISTILLIEMPNRQPIKLRIFSLVVSCQLFTCFCLAYLLVSVTYKSHSLFVNSLSKKQTGLLSISKSNVGPWSGPLNSGYWITHFSVMALHWIGGFCWAALGCWCCLPAELHVLKCLLALLDHHVALQQVRTLNCCSNFCRIIRPSSPQIITAIVCF